MIRQKKLITYITRENSSGKLHNILENICKIYRKKTILNLSTLGNGVAPQQIILMRPPVKARILLKSKRSQKESVRIIPLF